MLQTQWMKVDLHMHAPGIGQYFTMPSGRPLPQSHSDRAEFARQYVRHAREDAGLDMIAITNHNDTSWIDPLRIAAQDLYGDEFVVLPGLEIGADSGLGSIHLLAIFPESTKVEILERLLDDDLSLTPDKRFDPHGDVLPSTKSFSDVVKAVTDPKRGGIVIAAHVLSTNDSLLRSASNKGQSRYQQFLLPDLSGLDLAAFTLEKMAEKSSRWEFLLTTNQHNQVEFRRATPIALLNNSDAREFGEIGRQYTWIKGIRPSFESLRNALRNPEDRIRLKDNPPLESGLWTTSQPWIYSPPRQPSRYLRRLVVEKTNTGFLSGLSVDLHPGLNCMIGGRGSGKSAVIELLRYLWDHKPTHVQMQKFEDVFLPESGQAQVELTVDNALYRITRKGRSLPYVERWSDNIWSNIPNLKPEDLMPLPVFGQKEILHTSQNVQSQLVLLDRLCGDQLVGLKQQQTQIHEQLRQNREEVLRLHRANEILARELEQLPKVEESLRRWREQGIENKSREKDFFEQESQKWAASERLLVRLDETIQMVESQVSNSPSDLDDSQITDLPNASDLQQLRDVIGGIFADFRVAMEQLRDRQNTARRAIASLRQNWQKKYDEFDVGYRSALQQLQGITPDEIVRMERQRAELIEKQSLQSMKLKEVGDHLAERKILLYKLHECIQEQYDIRRKKASDLSTRATRVRITVDQSGDRDALVRKLRDELTGSRFRDIQYQLIADACNMSILPVLSMIELSDTENGPVFKLYSEWLPDDFDESASIKESVVSALQFSDVDQVQKLVQFLPLDKRLLIDDYVIPDRVQIELDIAREGRTPNWRALGQDAGHGVSIGQGCTAILSILLLESDDPLVVDQPEDDLDNRFIYDEVVQLLRRERGRRQIIVATHNANIPVGGDAEMIVALDVADGGEATRRNLSCMIVAQGFIDDEDVRDQVALVLEGGEEALRRRYRKYGF